MVIGKFHLGLQYDTNIWTGNPWCSFFNCREEKDNSHLLNKSMVDKPLPKKTYVDAFVVITESEFLLLEPDHKVKNVARLIACASLPSLEQVRRNIERPDNLQFVWRKVDEKDQWILNIVVPSAHELLNKLAV